MFPRSSLRVLVALAATGAFALAAGLLATGRVSGAATISPGTDATADLSVQQAVSPKSTPVPGKATFTIVIRNHGPATKRALLVDSATAGNQLVIGGQSSYPITTTQGTCTSPDTADTFTCKLGRIKPAHTVTVTFARNYCPPGGRVLTSHATVISALDPHPGNNTSRLADHTSAGAGGCG
ncbi:MAG: hypothetical protein JOZ25_09350 [Actinobacteria bacterium]|nr:hypothetical protein [Actinomycetota bacterium]